MSKLTDRAEELELEGNLEVALTYYEMALEDKSSPVDIRKDFGRVLNKLANYKEACDCFNLVLSMNDKNFEAWFGKGISNLGLNNWSESLLSFEKALEIDDTNANCYYYVSIIQKEFGNYLAQYNYNKFLKLDNNDFKRVREFYEFGLIFEQRKRELELKDTNKKINIDGYTTLLKSYGLNDEKVLCFLRTLPFKKLKEKISFFNDLKHKNDEKRIIFEKLSELGLDDNDIEELFKINAGDIETLKNEVINYCGVNPFEDIQGSIDVPYYVYENVVSFASKYNTFNELIFENSSRKSNIHKNNDSVNVYGLIKVKIKTLNPFRSRKLYSYLNAFNLIKSYISINEYRAALNVFEELGDLLKIPEESLKLNLIFYKASLLAINNKFKEALFYFECAEKLCYDIVNNPIFLFNKGNALYDCKKYDKSIECYVNSECDEDIITFLMYSAYYKLNNFDKVIQFYNELSDEYKDEKVLENIKNKRIK